ncbi:MAG: hypothetical protein WCY41_05265 [Candidatus Micrarchaeia archaeon]
MAYATATATATAARRQGEAKPKFPLLRLESKSLQLPVKERLEGFFFRNGCFDIYDSALCLPGLKSRCPTTVSTPEDLSQGSRKKMVAAIRQMVEAGEITLRELVDGKFIQPQAPIGYWDDCANARFWIDQLLDSKMGAAGLTQAEAQAVSRHRQGPETLSYTEEAAFRQAQRKAICCLHEQDFKDSGLNGMFQKPYQSKLHLLAESLYPELSIEPWELAETPTNYFESKENRNRAIRWLAGMMKKRIEDYTPEERRVHEIWKNSVEDMTGHDWQVLARLREKNPLLLIAGDLRTYGIEKLLTHVPGEHPLATAVCDAYPERNYRVWQMKGGPHGYFSDPKHGRERRVEAVIYIAALLGKKVRELTMKDLDSQACTILDCYPVHSAIFAIWEADMTVVPEMLARKPNLRTILAFEEWKGKQAA